MIPKGLFTQIGMMIVSVAIIFTYIQPLFAEVGKIQDDIGTYQEERSKVLAVNSRLSSLMSQMESVSVDDQRRLLTYLPDTVDDLSVSRDLLLISLQAGVLYKNVEFVGVPKSQNRQAADDSTVVLPNPHEFTLSVEGTYQQLKNLFALLEQNHYPLMVHGVAIEKLEGGFLTATITLTTYTFNNDQDNEVNL